MRQYELESILFLAVCGVASFSLLLFRFSSDKPRVLLPLNDAEEDGDQPILPGEPDPFAIAKAEDFLDGYPIAEDAFWTAIRLRKTIICVLLLTLVALQVVSFGFSLAEGSQNLIVVSTIHCVYDLYMLSLVLVSLDQRDSDIHWTFLVHLATLSAIGTFVLATITLLPSSPPPGTYSRSSDVPPIIWYTSLGLYLLITVLVITIPAGPALHFPSEHIYSLKTISNAKTYVRDNVCGIADASIWNYLLFSYTTKVVKLGYSSDSLEVGDLPIVTADMRSVALFARMSMAMKRFKLRGRWRSKPGTGWDLLYRMARLNRTILLVETALAAVSACLFYAPAFFLNRLVAYLENDPLRTDTRWGWFYCAGLFVVNAGCYLVTAQLWSISTTMVQVRFKVQLNSILFRKTLVRKDVASTAPPSAGSEETPEKKGEEDDFSSKAQIMNLMTTDVDRVSDFAWHLFSLIDSPIEICIGTYFLYRLLGISSFIGLAATLLFLPLNHWAGKVVVRVQDNLMKTRDERVALMNEVLGGIRMLKFMAWERSFESRVLQVRKRELGLQRLNYIIETCFNVLWNASPVFVTLISFWHYAVFRGMELTPSVAFTSIAVFQEMKFALSVLPETFLSMLQSLVSARRIEKYLAGVEVAPVPALGTGYQMIKLVSATITWPQNRIASSSIGPSEPSTPKNKFCLIDVSLQFPMGELSLICGKLGSGKSLLLLSLLGEADILAGQLASPRSPPDAIASFESTVPSEDDWIIQGLCAYVPQASWLQNATIRENILFNLPFVEERYQQTLEACSLISDLKIIEDGDEAEIGERGVNLSGGQKARVSLARAVYSRASIIFLDDVLSAVDAHTAQHLYTECLKGRLMRSRTVILVSHHVQLTAPGAAYIVTLDNGRVQFEGGYPAFQSSGIMTSLMQSQDTPVNVEEPAQLPIEENTALKSPNDTDPTSDTSSTVAPPSETESKQAEKRQPRKLIEEEKRAVGRISREVWLTYVNACGDKTYWIIFGFTMLLAALTPVLENSWIRIWSGSVVSGDQSRSSLFYIRVYAAITGVGLVLTSIRWFVLYYGSIQASTRLYERLLEGILFADIRFHDTVSRGRLLNRFGKDFEGIDSSLSDNFGRTVINALSVITTVITVTFAGGLPFLIATAVLGYLYFNVSKVYGQTSRDMRRLDSVTRSPLYSIYGETIAGVTVVRSFGAGSKFMRDMLRHVDTNTNPYFWMWGVNRWLSIRFNLLSSAVVGVTACIMLATPGTTAAMAGFALAFVSTITGDLLFMVRRFVGLEQSMVAVERVKEYSELNREPPEFVDPRPPADWPRKGGISCQNLVIQYSPDLPRVLHNLTFDVNPGEKVGILGRTGSGKSTLALSFFRFVEATEGSISIDGINIAEIGLTDLRSRLTIIPQDPTILSGTLRSTLDVFNEYNDKEIFEALRRVHLIRTGEDTPETVNVNVFRNLDSPVAEGGENFSTGEKQLLCMARAILKRSKVLVMDEATASVDYATDELISKTIRHEFAESTILTIAHRIRTVIDYSRVMVLDQGRIIEFDRPATLLANPTSQFYGLCKATGREEFATLRKLASNSI